jgi:hypothetical protein
LHQQAPALVNPGAGKQIYEFAAAHNPKLLTIEMFLIVYKWELGKNHI